MPEASIAGATPGLRARNAAAALGAIALACAAYALLPFHRDQLDRWYGEPPWAFSGEQFLWGGALVYGALVALYLLRERDRRPGKSLRFFALLGRLARAPRETLRQRLDPADRLALLTTLLKAFFGPLMAMSLLGFCASALSNGQGLLAEGMAGASLRELFDRFGFWFLMQLILFVDVAIFTVGYLVETRGLGNEIRSVDPTWLGWTAALVCYPPFNTVTATILGVQYTDFPQFEHPTVHLTLNLLLLALMAVYAGASVALGLKASNLTHRGIVARGPYAVVRHPAYACKNAAWWIGSAPLVAAAFGRGWYEGLLSVASLLGWTLLYLLRALTEEDHLRRVDDEYDRYAAKVRFRFLPGVA